MLLKSLSPCSHVINFVNIHLFHDEDNLVALEKVGTGGRRGERRGGRGEGRRRGRGEREREKRGKQGGNWKRGDTFK